MKIWAVRFRLFPINAFLIGEECKAARDSLIAACNQDGSGELIHPFFGKFQANCISASFKGGKKWNQLLHC